MGKVLTSNVYAPNGELLRRGALVPGALPKQFLDDIAESVVDEQAHPLLRLPVTTQDEVIAAWRKVHDHDPTTDPLVSVAADRVRQAATKIGLHRVARLRPFRDQFAGPDNPTPATVPLESQARRRRAAQ